MQQDGWPNAGEVVRHYRKHANLSACDVAQRYTQATGRPVATTWILDMESKNKVPTDITRRRALADILAIPPVLLGLAAREQVLLHPMGQAQPTATAPTVLKRTPLTEVDVTQYEKNIRLLWQLHHTSSAHDMVADVVSAIQQLERLSQQTSGSLLARIQFLLYSHYRLAAVVYRDQGQYQHGHAYASQAINIATELQKREWLAPALYCRGHINLVWGMLGEKTSQGLVTLDYTKVLLAINDLEAALASATRPQLQRLITSELSRARAYFAVRQGKVIHANFVTLATSDIKAAQGFIGRGSREDPYMQSLLNGGLVSSGAHLLNKAITYHLIGRSEEAEEILDDELEGSIPRSQTRQTAWMQIVRAQVALKQRDFFTATSMATSAFLACRDIHSVGNLAIINDIHEQLLTVKRANVDEQEVYDLGVMLTQYYASLARIS